MTPQPAQVEELPASRPGERRVDHGHDYGAHDRRTARGSHARLSLRGRGGGDRGVALFCYGLVTRTLTRPILADILRDAMTITAAPFALRVGARIFTLVVRAFGTDLLVANWLAHLAGSPRRALIIVLLMLALCAFVLDAYEMIFVVIPIVMPPLLIRVPDATWVAVLTLLVLQASFLVPPMGYAVLMVRHRIAKPIRTP